MLFSFEKNREKFIKKYKGKTVNIMWSGGLDSNALLLLALEAGCFVNLYIIEGDQLPNLEAERLNRQRITDKLNTEGQRNYRLHTIEHPKMDAAFYMNQLQMWLAVMMTKKFEGPILFGYVLGDEGISAINAVKKVWKAANFNRVGEESTVDFPLQYLHKCAFSEYVCEKLPFMSMYCERPEIVKPEGEEKYEIYKCEKCPSCKRMERVRGNAMKRNPKVYEAECTKAEISISES